MTTMHDSSAAILCDGQLIAAAEEERFSRKKHDGGVPFHAIEFCLRHAGLSMSQIDVIAYPDKPFRSGNNSYTAEMDIALMRRLINAGQVYGKRAILHKLALDAYLKMGLPSFNFQMYEHETKAFASIRQRYPDLPSVLYYDHHKVHAAAAYLTSGYDKAAITTIDGHGGPYSTVIWQAQGQDIARKQSELRINSLGFYYWYCTEYLGFSEGGEGKTMGLAAYGNRETYAQELSQILSITNDGWYEYRARPNQKILGFAPRNGQSVLDAPFPDFAAAAQDALERSVEQVVRRAIQLTGCRDLCVSGGVMLNCSSNGSLLRSGLADSIHVFPAVGDTGLSVGAALLCASELGQLRPRRLEHAYFGPGFTATAYETALRAEPRVSFHHVEDIATETAALLAAGYVVGWFQGRMELGPRALGNRSILADPRTTAMRDRVNHIKHRELWRPLAPVVLAERAAEFFTPAVPSPFMLFAMQVRADKRDLVPAIVHVDGSARPQTVTRSQNAILYDLLTAFERQTGVPVLLNTSFNDAGEPIVCSPQDAIRTFLNTGLDILVLGNYVVRKSASDL